MSSTILIVKISVTRKFITSQKVNCATFVNYRDQELRIRDDSGNYDSRKKTPEATISLRDEGSRTGEIASHIK